MGCRPEHRVLDRDGTILRHGNSAAYRAGCRCLECREHKRGEWLRSTARKARVASGKPFRTRKLGRSHGTTTMYRYGCRCMYCSIAKHTANAARPKTERRPAMPIEERRRRDRERYYANRDRHLQRMRERSRARRLREFAAADHRAMLLAAARAGASGELALLVAEQEADERCYRVWSFPLRDEVSPGGAQWDDPTADAALARVA